MHLTNCLLRRVDVAHESPVGAIGAATWTAGKLVFLAVAVAMCGQNVLAQTDVPFRVHLLNADSEFSAATAFDISGDGRTDIVCGAYWYEAPTWTRHHFREVEQIRGRFNDYSNLALDVDQDGDLDLVSANYRSKSLYWCRNPGLATDAAAPTAGLWEQITIDEPGTSETGRLVDVDGDGQMDVLPAGTSFAAWYEFRSGAAAGQIMWLRHNLPEQLIGHGIGAGDINGDGRTDIVGTSGWAESPLDARNGRWTWHADFQIAKDCGLPILVHDVDGDSDADLIWGRGHDVGLYWSEQLDESQDSFTAMPGVRLDEIEPILDSGRWLTHAIDTSWSCAHTLLLADIDGDGNQDLVAGKRFQGHDGKDPGENDPLAVYWYQFDVLSRTWQRHQISAGGSCGIDLDTVCCDLDDDGDMDIIAPSRSGLHWLENLRLGDPVQKALGSDITSASGQQPQRQPLEASAHATRDDLLILNSDGATTSIETPLQFGARREQIRQAMQQVMGPLPASDQRVPLDIHVQSIEAQDNYRRIKLTYQADATNRVPAYLLVPDAAVLNGAAMLCLHPTHFELGKAQICGLGGQPSRFYAHELAKLGFVCLAPDYPGFGDYEFDFASSEEAYVSGTMKVVWNNVRAIDLLEQLPGVDRDRIGAIGHSLGGHNALFTAVFDGRLRCVVTSCGFTAFEDYYSGDLTGWTSARYMPLIHQKYDSDPRQMPFDFPDILAAIAPRPVFVNAPISDTNFAVQGVKKCEAKLRPVLQLLGADDATKFFYPDAGHDFPNEIRSTAYQWLAKQLNVQRQ